MVRVPIANELDQNRSENMKLRGYCKKLPFIKS